LKAKVVEIVEASTCPSLGHVLLAALDCQAAVTTNYDRLYERAIWAVDRDVAVLPWGDPTCGRWILKMHGDVDHADKIVLTRTDFVRYDAFIRPAGSVLQSLVLTRKLLIVGASMSDDNVVRLAYEAAEYRRESGQRTRYGTLLDVDGKPGMRELWDRQLDWLTMDGASFEERARTLEVFLDAVAAFASQDASWLLDERFLHLLGDSAPLAARLRELSREVPMDQDVWAPLRAALGDLGAP